MVMVSSTISLLRSLLFALRLRAEERMMRETFGADYETYAARTKRLIPAIW